MPHRNPQHPLPNPSKQPSQPNLSWPDQQRSTPPLVPCYPTSPQQTSNHHQCGCQQRQQHAHAPCTNPKHRTGLLATNSQSTTRHPPPWPTATSQPQPKPALASPSPRHRQHHCWHPTPNPTTPPTTRSTRHHATASQHHRGLPTTPKGSPCRPSRPRQDQASQHCPLHQ